MKNLQLRKGQTMIEMLVAVSIIGVSLAGILTLLTRSIGVNKLATEQYVATYLASEGIELAKNLFDHSYLEEAQPGGTPKNFYGWTGTAAIGPGNGTYGIYEIDYLGQTLTPVTLPSCSLTSSHPTEPEVAALFANCPPANGGIRFLNVDSGIYSYVGGVRTQFRRAIIIDRPEEFSPPMVPANHNLDFRVTSVVGWQSRGGDFVVQLEDHFLPWRIPS